MVVTHRDPMLATATGKPFDRPGWIFGLKYDGFRVLEIRDKAGARRTSDDIRVNAAATTTHA